MTTLRPTERQWRIAELRRRLARTVAPAARVAIKSEISYLEKREARV